MKLVIIGAGISGLSTGCYAQLGGLQSEIFEMHDIPGGVCTSWRRGDYLFDHCLHWVIGSNKGTSLYPIFKELGVADRVDFYNTDRFRIISIDDQQMTVYTDLSRFKQELLRLFPEERQGIERYFKLLWKYTKFNPPMDGDFGSFGVLNFLKMLPFMPSFIKLKTTTIERFLGGLFQDDVLKEMLFRLFPVKNMPALMAVMPLSFMHNKEGGYPLGGSLNFAQAIAERYQALGGKISYGSKVKQIVVEDGVAKGVTLADGRFVAADLVVSACDGRSVLYDLLGGKYLEEKNREFYENPQLWPPLISISLGVKRDFSGMGEINDFKLKEPLLIGGKEILWSGFFHYCHDPNFAPKGKSVIQTQIETDYSYWRDLHERDRDRYNQEKELILEKYISVLEDRFPGIREDIEETDVATPVTWERYTGNWQGSYEGWVPTIKNFGTTLPRKLRGLKHFYMTGQWISPGGGVPMCMAQGKLIVKEIMKERRA